MRKILLGIDLAICSLWTIAALGMQNSMGRYPCNMDCNVTYYVTSAALVHALP